MYKYMGVNERCSLMSNLVAMRHPHLPLNNIDVHTFVDRIIENSVFGPKNSSSLIQEVIVNYYCRIVINRTMPSELESDIL